MSNLEPRRLNSLFAPRAKKERRPAGVSRRRRKQLAFEPLESRQVMSASAIVQPFQLSDVGSAPASSMESLYSTLTADQQATLARELWWYEQMEAAGTANSGYATNALPNDPLFGQQWHLLNTGQNVGGQDFQPIFGVPGEDINVLPAWNLGYTGEGVTVAVLDSGTQLNHPDLAGNINLALSFDALNPSGNGNPIFFNPLTAHGTAVAGLIGAIANNGIGGAGVAPGVTLVPIRLIDFGTSPFAIEDAFRHTIFNGIDITNNSWGPTAVRGIAGPSVLEFAALRDSVLFGREGKGVIHVFAAGNDGGPLFSEGFQSIGGFDSSAYNGYVNNRYVIGVTGVDHDGFYNNVDGTVTAYPEISTSILVAAPTGSNAGPVIVNDLGIGSGLWTTDLTGDFGYNVAPDPNGQETQDPFYPFDRDFLGDTNYTSRMNGTSGATPLVTGVIALMLEANPELTWRDVQEILVRSARQNAPLGVPETGQSQGLPTTQNTWIVNQTPIFHDPDPYNPAIPDPPDFRTLNPILDPNFSLFINGSPPFGFNPDHYVATPHAMTNGAGYTVSQGVGFYGESIGYAHGVIDAGMAVKLAEQWHVKNQALAPELTFTSFVQGATRDLPNARFAIPTAQVSSLPTLRQVVPGGIGGFGPFIQWWEEYFDAAPDFGVLPPMYRGDSSLEFNVPTDQTMKIETVEVKISLDGDSAAALDHMRILLISPDGTHSELNQNWLESPGGTWTFQLDERNPNLPIDAPLSRATRWGQPGSIDNQPNDANLVWSVLTNRSWGERSDDALVFDPTTGMPVIDDLGFFGDDINSAGEALTQGWRLVIENYSLDASYLLAGVEVAFHGSPIAPNSERVQGFVGIDDDRDDFFNYSRMIRQDFDLDNDPTVNRLGEIQTIVDPNVESFASNVTVVARRASDNQVVARFVTGADGNYCFDLVPDEYIISIEDPLGRVAQEDSITASGFLQDYKTEWRIGPEHFKVWQKNVGDPNETPVDANGVPIPWLDGNGDEVVYGVKGINFLLDPGEAPADQVSFSGTVYADTNGDGLFNSNDVVLPNATVYVDLNRNGAFDSGEVTTITDAAGQYTLVQTGITSAAVVNVGIVPPAQWTTTNPSDGLHTQFVLPGEVYGNFDFFIDPPANNAGGGGADQPGILMGTVFEDLNSDGIRNGLEIGAPSITVYLDANNNGIREAAETSAQTNQFGAYVFTEVAPGQQIVRVDIASPLVQTTPAAGQPWIVNLTGSSTISTLHFGFFDLAVNDYGDLPNSYEMRPDGNGGFIFDPARHKKGQYWLGANVDGEVNNAPTPNANGDDLLETDDENGVVFDPIAAGTTGRLTVTANTYTGYLQGWVDWNDDGDFLDDGERIVTDQLLIAGQNFIFYSVPDDVTVLYVRARFRFGEHSTNPTTGVKRAIDSPFGFAQAGEVEDYYVPVADPAPLVVGIPGDADGDEDVDGNDFLSWQRNVGKSTGATTAQGDANGDGDVDSGDLDQWQENFGASETATVSGLQAGTASSGAAMSLAGAGNAYNPAAGWSQSTVMSSSVAGAAEWLSATKRPGLQRVAGRLSELGERLNGATDNAEERIAEVRERLAHVVANGRGQLQSLRRDEAFDDLFGAADEALEDLAADLADNSEADEAFAGLGSHFRWDR